MSTPLRHGQRRIEPAVIGVIDTRELGNERQGVQPRRQPPKPSPGLQPSPPLLLMYEAPFEYGGFADLLGQYDGPFEYTGLVGLVLTLEAPFEA